MKITLRDCENGQLLGGIKFAAQLSKDPIRRIDYAKVARRLEKALTEPLAEWSDVVREFNTEGDGKQGVDETKMSKDRLAEWRGKSKEWRNSEIDFEFYPGGGTGNPADGKLEIKLGRRGIGSIPESILEGMVDYCSILEDTDETKEEGLEEVIKKIRSELDALQKEAKR